MRFGSPSGAARRTPQWVTAALFALLCAVAAYWLLQLLAPRAAIAPAASLIDTARLPDLQRAAAMFGTPGGQPDLQVAAASDIAVLGVAAAQARASAVLAIDGGSPKAFAVGDAIDRRTRLVEISAEAIVIDRGAGLVRLPAPARPDPALLSAGPASAGIVAPAAPARFAPAPTRSAATPASAANPGPVASPGPVVNPALRRLPGVPPGIRP